MKRFQIEILVDEEALIAAYCGGNDSIDRNNLPDTKAMLEHELAWCSASGIELVGEKEQFMTGPYGYISDDQITKEYGAK